MPLAAQSAAPPSTLNAQRSTNKVLELEGKTGYVELPPIILNDLDEATVEVWVKWRSTPTNAESRIFSYGARNHDAGFQAFPDGRLNIFFQDHQTGLKDLFVPQMVQTNAWYHLALTSGRAGMKLYLDGALLATNEYTGSFSALNPTWRIRSGI